MAAPSVADPDDIPAVTADMLAEKLNIRWNWQAPRWTESELDAIRSYEFPESVLVARLGRTRAAISNKRARLRSQGKFDLPSPKVDMERASLTLVPEPAPVTFTPEREPRCICCDLPLYSCGREAQAALARLQAAEREVREARRAQEKLRAAEDKRYREAVEMVERRRAELHAFDREMQTGPRAGSRSRAVAAGRVRA